jgi:hypothetical protein
VRKFLTNDIKFSKLLLELDGDGVGLLLFEGPPRLGDGVGLRLFIGALPFRLGDGVGLRLFIGALPFRLGDGVGLRLFIERPCPSGWVTGWNSHGAKECHIRLALLIF